MANEPSGSPSRQDLPARGQQLLTELVALHDRMTRDLADQVAALTQARGELSQARSELSQGRAQQSQLAADAERLRKAHDALSADNQALQARIKAQEAQLATLHEEREQLSALYADITSQTTKLAADWSARRDRLTADKQQLAAELEEARTTLTLSQERDRQWKAQVWKLQDEVKTLRTGAGRVTLTPEQSHHVYSQLNAIVGFAEVLLDEAGNRASGVERQEFLEHIKASGVQLVGYMNRLTLPPGDAGPMGESAGDGVLASPPGASPVLVAAADPTVRDRLEALLSRAGYRVEFAADAAEGLKRAVELQPLAIVVDTDLPPNGAQKLVDDLSGEPRARDIPVVLTAKNDEEQLGVSMGQVDFLKKPLNRQQVLQVMAKYDLLADRRRAQKMPTSVLVIDDDPRNTRLVQAMLKPFSIDVLSTNDGAAGIKLARTRKPDLIILDLMMPEVDGFEVVSAIRADAATAEIPILIYTAKNITLADRQRLQSSIQAIIRKGDLTKEQFLDLIYRRGERRRRPRADEAAA
ncbi:MAG TPA: response regulator [Candidatus Dormibacteraeota bacterium]